MLQQPTLQLLYELRLPAMAAALEEQQGMPDINELSFEDRLTFLLEREKTDRSDRRFQRLLARHACASTPLPRTSTSENPEAWIARSSFGF